MLAVGILKAGLRNVNCRSVCWGPGLRAWGTPTGKWKSKKAASARGIRLL